MIYNATPQSRTGLSPYYVDTGRVMKLPIDVALSRSELPAVQHFAEDLQQVWKTTQDILKATQERDKTKADATRREANISVGD